MVANAEQESSYDYEDNRLTVYVDPKGNNYTYDYDDTTKLLTSATTQKGATYSYSYDDYGNAKEVVGSADGIGSLKAEVNYSYPAEDSTTYSVTAKDQDKNTSTEVYDKSTGTLQSVTDTKGIITNYTYDSDTDRVLSIIKNNNQSVEYTYDNSGRYTGISHEGTTYSFGYDKFGNRTTTSVGSRTLSTNTYLPHNGNLTQTTYGNGATIAYTYDNFGNVKEMSYSGTPALKNFTDSAGNVNRTQDLLTNLEHRVTYDSTGRLISKEVLNLSEAEDRWLHSLEYDYDLNNNVSRFAYADRKGSNVTRYEYGLDNLLEKTTLSNDQELSYTYDTFGRLTAKSLNTATPLNYSYTYMQSLRGTDYTTTKIERETIGDTTYKYTYDTYGNITVIAKINSDNTTTPLYTYNYDQYNQLIKAIDYAKLEETEYTYNLAGNITHRYKYQLDAGLNIIDTLEDVRYSYGDSQWKDLLTTYNGQTITYDAIGNPLNYRDDITLTWQNGRELATYSDDNYDIEYTYDASGIRTGKTVTFGTSTYNYSYVYEGGMLLQMTRNNYVYDFIYDANGTPIGFRYTTPSGTESHYYYGINSRGDVVAIYDVTGAKVASYSYDAYGKPLTTTFSPSSLSATIKNIINNNPLRYRSYVYDTESGLYYLQSRYYDPTTCRFVNGDSQLNIDSFNGYNMFAYCSNNPIKSYDPTGTREPVIGGLLSTETAIERAMSCAAMSNRKIYASADDAAMGFANETYSASSYALHEYSTEIYTIARNGMTTYHYTLPALGSPHSASGININRVDNIVAYAHTHPNSIKFSQADKDYADYYGIDAYVVGPNLVLQKYDHRSQEEMCFETLVSPYPLTNSQRNTLRTSLYVSWNSHMINGRCPKGFGCELKQWPND